MDEQQSIAFVDPPWLAYARTKLGVHEMVGVAVHPWIAECFELVGLKGAQDDTTAWCSAGMNGIFHYVGMPGTRSAAARSWLTYGEAITELRHGCIVILKRPPVQSHGHVTLYDATGRASSADFFPGLGCNQHNAVCVADEPRRHIIGIRWPLEESIQATRAA